MNTLSEEELENDLDTVYTHSDAFVTSKVTQEQTKMRLDKFLASCFPEFSRTQIARMIEDEPELLEALNEAAPTSDVSTIATKRGFRISNSPNIDDDDVISEPSDKP